MDGGVEMTSGTIFDLLRVVLRDAGRIGDLHPRLKALLRMRGVLYRFADRNGLLRARANVAHHYDLSSDLYELFLDRDRQYSCAYFPTPDIGLETAQQLKKRHIAAKLCLDRPDLEVLDIGCGWGGMGRYLAEIGGAQVTGVTLSEEQHAYATAVSADRGLAGRTDYRLQDYRKLNMSFDRIVSVGMFEHVGAAGYTTFFGKVAEMLRPDGVMLLHTIGQTGSPTATNPFIRKYIFPGGYIPSMSEMLPHIERAGLVVTDVEILRLHYAETLKAWRERFAAHRAEAEQLYDERFCRMWEFYLAASEASFRWREQVVFQLQLAHRQDAVPVTRDYIAAAETVLAEREAAAGRLPLAGE
ncbi:SAM-dependent methyltransferase [Pontivivens ytuae]|nr:cyclopropane-fatty-acyl-phospholipid synthase family protein [Pontivivens ytuae]